MNVLRTFERVDVLDCHAQHGQLVQLPVHGATHGDEGGQLGDVGVHLVSAPLLDLRVVLSHHGRHAE